MLFLWVSGILLIAGFYFLNEKDDEWPLGFFLLLYCSSPIWSYQFYFICQEAEIMLALCLTVISAYLTFRICFLDIEKKNMNTLWSVVAFGILLLVFGTYQSIIIYYISISCFFYIAFLCGRIKKKCCIVTKDEMLRIASYLLHFIIAYLIYRFISKNYFTSMGYLEEQIRWGRVPVKMCLLDIGEYIVEILFPKVDARYISCYLVGMLSTIIGLIFLMKVWTTKDVFIKVLFVMAILGLLLSPFILVFYMGAIPAARTQFALPVSAGALGTIGIYMCRKYLPSRWQKKSKGLVWFASLICLIQVICNLQLQYTDYIRFKEDVIKAEWVIDKIENSKISLDKPILFVGKKESELNKFCSKNESYGYSAFEWDYSDTWKTGATRRIAWFIEAYSDIRLDIGANEVQMQRAVEYAKFIESYPSEESVVDIGDIIVVKLSD